MKTAFKRITPIVAIVLLAVLLLAACEEDVPRLSNIATYNPGAAFSTNFNTDDPRRQVKCSVIFEVIDELAVEELNEHNYKVRNSTLDVLGELTMEEITTSRHLSAIAERIVVRVNADLNAIDSNGESIDLVIRAYFTEFVLN